MAATEARRPVGLLTAAALALPGVMPGARAEEAPEAASIALKVLNYRESQPVGVRYPYYDGSEPGRFDRITVHSPAAQLVLPLGRRWSVQAGLVVDDVSGASPRYYSDVSGASRMSDRRTAVDARLSRHDERSGWSVGLARSKERDYLSQSASVEGRWASEDNNTTVAASVGGASDTITPVGGGVRGVERDTRKTAEGMLAVTRALTANDLMQLTLAYSAGRGSYDDPYKQSDVRPRRRDSHAFTLRWNHFVEPLEATLRSSGRYYADTFGIRAGTLELAWVQPVGPQWRVTPSLRYYTQSSADFYVDPVTDLAIYPGPGTDAPYHSADARLSAFGAITLGIKGELRWQGWTFDLKLERYEQRSEWRRGGDGSPGIDPLKATAVQVGVARSF